LNYVRIVTVSPGATPAESGARLLQAHAAVPEGALPVLLQLEPGTYDLGTQRLVLGPSVSLAGAGRNVTTVTGQPSGGALVVVGNRSTLTRLTVSAQGGTDHAVAVSDAGSGGWYTLHDLGVRSSGGPLGARGLELSSFALLFEDVHVDVSGSGSLTGLQWLSDANGSATFRRLRVSMLSFGAGATVTGLDLDGGIVRAYGLEVHALGNPGAASVVGVRRVRGNYRTEFSDVRVEAYRNEGAQALRVEGSPVFVHNGQLLCNIGTPVHATGGALVDALSSRLETAEGPAVTVTEGSTVRLSNGMLGGAAPSVAAGSRLTCHAMSGEDLVNPGGVAACP
jgi:hypothetical protein